MGRYDVEENSNRVSDLRGTYSHIYRERGWIIRLLNGNGAKSGVRGGEEVQLVKWASDLKTLEIIGCINNGSEIARCGYIIWIFVEFE